MKNKLPSLDLTLEARKFNNQLKIRINYQKYLDEFETRRPPLAGGTGPMSFEEWQSAQKLVARFSKPIETSKRSSKKKR